MMNTTITSLGISQIRINIIIEIFLLKEPTGETEIHYLINQGGLKYIYCTDLEQLVDWFYKPVEKSQIWQTFDSEEDFEEHIEDLNIEWV